MTFTDDDLNGLKEWHQNNIASNGEVMRLFLSLLARLEAAEKDRDTLYHACLVLVESDMDEDIDMDSFIEAIESYEDRRFPDFARCKASGKAGDSGETGARK